MLYVKLEFDSQLIGAVIDVVFSPIILMYILSQNESPLLCFVFVLFVLYFQRITT